MTHRSILAFSVGLLVLAAASGCSEEDNPDATTAGPGSSSSSGTESGGAGGTGGSGPSSGGSGGVGGTGGAGGVGGTGGTGGGETGGGGSGGSLAFQDPSSGQWAEGFGVPGLGGFAARAEALVEGSDGRVYAAGIFTDAGGQKASNVAVWDGTSWKELGLGLPGWVKALAFGPDGDLYAGGALADGVNPNQLMRWDGSAWVAVPGEVQGNIEALALHGEQLLVGGAFGSAGNTSSANIAAWDGTAWSAVGTTGTDYDVYTVLSTGPSSFCLAGAFSSIDGVPASFVGCWDGTDWSQLGDGLPGFAYELVKAPDGTFFVGGTMGWGDPTSVYEIGVGHLVGDVWEAFEGGVFGGGVTSVRALAFDDDGNMLVGGTFVGVGNPPIQAGNVAKWDFDAAGWSQVGGGVRNEVGVALGAVIGVNDILPRTGTDTYVVGGLFSACNDGAVQAANIAELEDNACAPMIDLSKRFDGLGGLANDLVLDSSGALVAGGYFPTAGGLRTDNVARFGANGWEKLGDGLDNVVRALHVSQAGVLYAGGDFGGSGNAWAPHFAKFVGNAWQPAALSVDNTVTAIAEAPNGDLYIGGDFTVAGGVAVNGIARWDGVAFHALGEGFDNRVTSIAIDASGSVIATGLFANSGAIAVDGLAKWDGASWSGFGSGLDGGYGSRVVADGQGFIVGGNFDSIDGTPFTGLARWDGAAWTSFGTLDGSFGPGSLVIVTDVQRYGDTGGLFATGIFGSGDGVEMSYVGWYDGADWYPLAGGLADLGEALVVDPGAASLWVGGGFVEVDGRPNSGVARWDFVD